VDSNKTVRPVFGFAGNFWMGSSVLNGAESASFSRRGGFAKRADSLAVLDARGRVLVTSRAPQGLALFGFTAQDVPALVYFPSTREMLRIRGRQAVTMLTDPSLLGGDVLSLALSDDRRADFIVLRDRELWMIRVDLEAGALVFETPLPGVSQPVLLQPGGKLFYTFGRNLVVRCADGTETKLPVAFTPGAMESMGAGLLNVTDRDSTRRFAWNPDARQISQLPEEAPR
jgi:hypothetical protein